MSITKLQREKKRQLGQFLTPPELASRIIDSVPLSPMDRVLEPSMGDGSFIIPLIERFLPLHQGSQKERLSRILSENIWGVEIDEQLYRQCLHKIDERWGYLPKKHNLVRGDFFRMTLPTHFNLIVGNPPFGGSFDPTTEDALDAIFGVRNGEKIKKETYAFFIVKSTDLLKNQARMTFICSNTFLTINTMRGLRSHLMHRGDIDIQSLPVFSDETSHPMVVLSYTRTGAPGKVTVGSEKLSHESIKKTANLSFGIKQEFEKYFTGPRMGDLFVATSGMTTGKNEYFVREIQNGCIDETYEFSFRQKPIRLSEEIKKARLGNLSEKIVADIKQREAQGIHRRTVSIEPTELVKKIKLPHHDYQPYNKAINTIIYSPPTHVIYWKDDGDAVKTYKKTGNWYLRGIGGQSYFFREGLTWQLIASRMHMRYLPSGYVLDSGAPCAFTRKSTPKDDLYFALGWTLTRECNRILKEVINHTKNIQGKDFERLPYPFWVSSFEKRRIIALVKGLVTRAKAGEYFTYENPDIEKLDALFAFHDVYVLPPLMEQTRLSLSV